MSWLYLPEQAGDCSPQNGYSNTASSATSNGMPIASKPSRRESKTASSTTLPSGTTCELSTAAPGVESWIASLRDSRASPGVRPVTAQAKPTTETYGLTPYALLERCSPQEFFWRTPLVSFFTNTSELSSANWPKVGLMSDGVCYQLGLWDYTIAGRGYGLWLTPTASDGLRHHFSPDSHLRHTERNKAKGNGQDSNVAQMTRLFGLYPTPEFGEWLMGLPIGWTNLEPLATDKFRQWLEQHGICWEEN